MQITQWNCSSQDNFDEKYLEEALKNSDLCLLQRCKDNFLFVAQNKFSNVFDIKHSSNRSLVIGTNFNIEQQKHFELPTFNLLKKHNDPNQGSVAQSVVIKDTQIINFQIAYEDESINEQCTYDDFGYIFENIVERDNCLIVGDIHYEPDTPLEIIGTIEYHKFKDNTNHIATFSKVVMGNIKSFRHDRILTKGNIKINNLQSFARSHTEGNAHWIINYVMEQQ